MRAFEVEEILEGIFFLIDIMSYLPTEVLVVVD